MNSEGFFTPVHGWRLLFWSRAGRLRAFWRIALFLLLFGVIDVVLELLLRSLPVGSEKLSIGLSSGVALIAAVIAGVILLRYLERRPARQLGFAWSAETRRDFAVGWLIGGGSLLLVVIGIALARLLTYAPDSGTPLAYVAALAIDAAVLTIAAAAEEALFRGYPFQVLVQSIGARAATILASGGFALAHVGNPSVDWLALVNIFLAGVLLSVAFLRTWSLWFATAVHVGWNWTMASLLDLPVSGLQVFDTPLYEPLYRGPRFLTGEAFGPEGGIIGTIAFGAALVAVHRFTRTATRLGDPRLEVQGAAA